MSRERQGTKKAVRTGAARKATTTKGKKVAPVQKAKAKAPRKETTPAQAPKHVEGNPYRAGSSYAVCFDTLAKMGRDKPVSRKDLLAAYAKVKGDEKKAGYDLAVILSPTKEGEGHRSSRKHAYWVERRENGFVQLHMAN